MRNNSSGKPVELGQKLLNFRRILIQFKSLILKFIVQYLWKKKIPPLQSFINFYWLSHCKGFCWRRFAVMVLSHSHAPIKGADGSSAGFQKHLAQVWRKVSPLPCLLTDTPGHGHVTKLVEPKVMRGKERSLLWGPWELIHSNDQNNRNKSYLLMMWAGNVCVVSALLSSIKHLRYRGTIVYL